MKGHGKHFIFWIIVAAIIAVDQITKFLVRQNIIPGQSIPLIKGFFSLIFMKNTGSGFSLFTGANSYLIWIMLIIIGAILYYYPKIMDTKNMAIPFALIIGGAIGNLIDRIFLGYVVDFIDLYIIFDHYPAFNLADSCISIGAIIVIIILLKDEIKNTKIKKK